MYFRHTTPRLRYLTVLASLLAVLVLLAACTVAQPAAAPAEEAAEAGAAPATGEEVVLRTMHWDTLMLDETEFWDDILTGFEEQHPGVTVENNFVPFGQYLTTLEAMAAGDELPDVFWGHVQAAQLGRAGRTIDYKEFFDPEFFDQFYSGPLRQFQFDDAIYALPWTAQTFGLFVNDDIMTELGLEPPNTWDELIAMSPQIIDAGYVPLAWGNGQRNVCPDFFLPLIAQYGGDVYALDDLTDPTLSWDSEPVIQAFELLQNLSENGVFMEGINGIPMAQAVELAYQGRAAMMFTGSWQPGSIDTDAPQEYIDAYYVYKNPAIAEGEPHWTGDGSGAGWVVNGHSDNLDLSLDFIRYLFSDEVYNQYIAGSQTMPSKPSALDAVENEKVREMTTWLDEGADHILFGQGSWDAVSNACQAVLDGSLSPTDAAAQVQADVEAARSR